MTDRFASEIREKARASFGATAELKSLTALAGDASSRRYYRAALSGAGGLETLIVMALPPENALPLSSEELAVFKEPLKELPFLNLHRFLDHIGVRVPRLYGYWEKDGLLFLEDLGDTALWDQVQGQPETSILTWYRRAIDELLRLQLDGTRLRDERCIAFQQRFDFRLYMWEFKHFLEYGLEKRPDLTVRRTTLEALTEIFAGIAHQLDRLPACLNHRDYHSWNLMVHDGAVAIIDFQDALLAPPQYDLASLLNDRVTDSIILPERENLLVRYYIDRYTEGGGEIPSRDEFLENYLLSVIQRDLKVVGRFFYLDLVKGKPGYKAFIPATVKRLKRNLVRLSATAPIVPLLADHYEEMR